MKSTSSNLLMVALLNMLMGKGPKGATRNMVFQHKKLVKSGITSHKPKPGRNHPAKGYDQETKTWHKEQVA